MFILEENAEDSGEDQHFLVTWSTLARIKKKLRDIAKVSTITMSIIAVIFGLWLRSQWDYIYVYTNVAGTTQGEIIFIDNDMNRVMVNPVHAEVWAHNSRGEFTAINWRIKQPGSEHTLYSGENCISDADLAQVLKASEDGEYTLFISMQDPAGHTYTLQKTFWVENIDSEQ